MLQSKPYQRPYSSCGRNILKYQCLTLFTLVTTVDLAFSEKSVNFKGFSRSLTGAILPMSMMRPKLEKLLTPRGKADRFGHTALYN